MWIYFISISRANTGESATSPPNAALLHDFETSSESSTTDSGKESVADDVADEPEKQICLKSSMKKPLSDCSVPAAQDVKADDSSLESPSSTFGFAKRRKVQWTDACGKELLEIKEFEIRYSLILSESESTDTGEVALTLLCVN
ncbi:uncharacterized protein LOC122031372 [Zingiber officinale]|uniref:uncharacterized protein LOC122031372 n=1 Tax=Zingiber officinale TaxID=94328 RepID=UPI001C4AE6E0|nr:uncharacterized protein LOC122031372 [Zingiber officinale]